MAPRFAYPSRHTKCPPIGGGDSRTRWRADAALPIVTGLPRALGALCTRPRSNAWRQPSRSYPQPTAENTHTRVALRTRLGFSVTGRHCIANRSVNASLDRLDRFLAAQSADYVTALAELERGRKRSHWMWYILPQLRGLGMSAMSHKYGIAGLEEAEAYLAHPILGPRLRACVSALCAHTDTSAADILGDIDAQKLRSCLTLFAAAAKHDDLFDVALRQFFGGAPDPKTIELLASSRGEG